MLQVTKAHIKIENRALFDCDHFSLKKGQITALLGKNGTGKSTFLSAICRLNNYLSGECVLDEKSIFELPQKVILKKIAIVPVKQLVFGKLSLIDLVLSGKMAERNFLDITKKEDVHKANAILEQLGMASFSEQLFSNLSDGEQKLGLLAKALFQEADYLFLDEPEAFLDVGNRIKVFKILKSLAEQGKSILFSTHQPDLAKNYCSHIAFIANGNLKTTKPSDYNEELLNEIYFT